MIARKHENLLEIFGIVRICNVSNLGTAYSVQEKNIRAIRRRYFCRTYYIIEIAIIVCSTHKKLIFYLPREQVSQSVYEISFKIPGSETNFTSC